ncbi:MAG: DUF5591 domain-containing protein [Bradyrhizobium sp.]
MPKTEVFFSELRDDWYRGADLMARLVHQSSQGVPRLVGFPAQWIPIFEHFGARWSDVIDPPSYVPIVSDLSIETLMSMVAQARRQGRLRVLVEGIASFDPLVADVLHKLDRRVSVAVPALVSDIQFTGWQSYGRPEVLDFEARVLRRVSATSRSVVLLPCARRRPYSGSKTHRRLVSALSDTEGRGGDQIVISSLGVVPAIFWSDPVVLAYDSGVPDIYRVLRLMRAYFCKAPYEFAIDCLEFEPYRDCLRIIQREGLIGEIRPGPMRKVRKLPLP